MDYITTSYMITLYIYIYIYIYDNTRILRPASLRRAQEKQRIYIYIYIYVSSEAAREKRSRRLGRLRIAIVSNS